MFIFLG